MNRQELQTEIKNLINRLDDIYLSLMEAMDNHGPSRDNIYIKHLEDKLTFGECRLYELKQQLRRAG